jgi:hypothetical protein
MAVVRRCGSPLCGCRWIVYRRQARSKGQAEITDAAVDKMGWILTRRIDFSDSNAIGRLMLEVEETRSAIGSTGVEHREIRWRSATVESSLNATNP